LAFFASELRISYTKDSLKIKIGLIKERKDPPDRRVAFLPEQCSSVQNKFPGIRFFVESSEIRCVQDEVYIASGIEVTDDLRHCDVLFGIKEVPIWALQEGKSYFFFSHTIKKQLHNRKLLKEILAKKITLIDYECLVDQQGNRTVAFGRFAGIVGAYNAFRMWLFRYHGIHMKSASECGDMEEMLDYARHHTKVIEPVKIAVTGSGRVGKGAVEVLRNLKIRQVEPEDYLNNQYDEPIFTWLSSRHYLRNPKQEIWDEKNYRENPMDFERHFLPYAYSTDILIPCHYWNPKAPVLFTAEEIILPQFKIKVISDVTCDLEGSVPTTIRTSTIGDPFYDYNPEKKSEAAPFSSDGNITVCAVDNLPCELPWDASKSFGEMLIETIIPELLTGQHVSMNKATIAKGGQLMPGYQYLADFVLEPESL
jgi:saccharopine dehydrogenase (NAD+, L-lysine forming)